MFFFQRPSRSIRGLVVLLPVVFGIRHSPALESLQFRRTTFRRRPSILFLLPLLLSLFTVPCRLGIDPFPRLPPFYRSPRDGSLARYLGTLGQRPVVRRSGLCPFRVVPHRIDPPTPLRRSSLGSLVFRILREGPPKTFHTRRLHRLSFLLPSLPFWQYPGLHPHGLRALVLCPSTFIPGIASP